MTSTRDERVAPDRQVRSLLRRIDPGEPGSAELALLLARVKREIGARERPARSPWLRVGVASIVLASAGVVAASLLVRAKTDVAPARQTTPARAAIPIAPPDLPDVEPEIEPEAKPAPQAPATLARPRVRRTAVVSRPANPVAAPPSPVAPAEDSAMRESQLLKEAIAALRGRDAARALARLDERERAFPSGLLATEAAVVRVEALVTLGRSAEALARVESLPAEDLPRRDEILIIRGELRATANRCAAATRDFDAVLGRKLAPVLEERARYGRAVCLARDGRRAEARDGFAEYLRRFPAGRFAPAARSALSH